MGADNIVRRAAENLSQGAEGSEEFVTHAVEWSQTIDTVNLTGLLPVAVTMMILHELWWSTSESRAPRIGWMLMRVIGFGACLAGYDRLVGMLTGLVGGGAWPEIGDLIAPLDYAIKSQKLAMKALSLANWGELLGSFIIWTFLFAIDCLMGLFAIVAITVLVKLQALLLVVFIACGKTCLILSILPGVGIAKSWAKVTASVAAWSFMAGIVFSAVGLKAQLAHYSASDLISAHVELWLTYALIGIFTISIPKLVGALVSGSMSAAPGLGMAIGGAVMAAKLLGSPRASVSGIAQTGGRVAGAGARVAGAGARVAGKVERSAGIAVQGAANSVGRGASATANKVGGNAVRSAALSLQMRGGGSKSSMPSLPEAPAPITAAAGRPDGTKQGNWDVPATAKSPEQWKAEGWSPMAAGAPRAATRPGYRQHRVESGWDERGNNQYARWVQVPKKSHGPSAPSGHGPAEPAPSSQEVTRALQGGGVQEQQREAGRAAAAHDAMHGEVSGGSWLASEVAPAPDASSKHRAELRDAPNAGHAPNAGSPNTTEPVVESKNHGRVNVMRRWGKQER